MATSYHNQISLLMEIIMATRPTSVLDIGVGRGKYGVLCREYLDDLVNPGSRSRIDGIEAFPGYLTPLHSHVYDKIYLGDATAILPNLDRKYDVALLIDVFEHFDRAQGAQVVALLERVSGSVLISVPAEWWPQGPSGGNVFQTHRAHYSWKDFKALGFTQVWRAPSSFLALKSKRHVRLRRSILRWSVAGLLPLPASDIAASIVHWLAARRGNGPSPRNPVKVV